MSFVHDILQQSILNDVNVVTLLCRKIEPSECKPACNDHGNAHMPIISTWYVVPALSCDEQRCLLNFSCTAVRIPYGFLSMSMSMSIFKHLKTSW